MISVIDVVLLLGGLGVFVLCLAAAYKIVHETKVRTALLREMAQNNNVAGSDADNGLVGRLQDLGKTQFSRPVRKQSHVSLFRTNDTVEREK